MVPPAWSGRARVGLASLLLAAACATGAEPVWSTSATRVEASGSPRAWRLERYGSDGFDTVSDIAAMPDGGFVIAGHFEDVLDLGSDRLVSAGETDAFIARFDPAGQVAWAAQVGGPGFDAGAAVVVDRRGLPILIGNLSGSARADTWQLRGRGMSDVFAASFGDDGAVRWAVAFGASDWDAAAAAALTRDGDLAIVGSTGGADHDSDRARADDSDVLVALVGSDGHLVWTRTAGGVEWDQGLAVAAYPDGDIAVGGSFAGRIEIGRTSMVSAGLSDGFIARMSPSGRVRAASRVGGKGADAVSALAITGDGATAAAGEFSGTLRIGGDALTSSGECDVFLARSAPDGEPAWAIRTGGRDTDSAGALLALPDGTLLLAISSSLTLELVASGPSEVAIQRVGSSGRLGEVLRLSGSLVTAHALAATGDGTVAVVGSFARRMQLGARTIESDDRLDGFLATAPLEPLAGD